MAYSRRQFIKASGGIALAGAGSVIPASSPYAQSPEFVLKWSNNLQLSHPVNQRAGELAENIRRDTDGRVDLRVFPNSQMGSDPDVLSQIRAGGIDCVLMSGLIFSTLVPVASINGVGFAFKDYSQVWAAMDGGLGGHVRGALAKVGLLAMDKMWDSGFRQITTSSKPINSLADIRGLKIRVPGAPIWTTLFKAIGAAPTPVNYTELYSALQTKAVEGQENPLAIIQSTRLYEVQKYVAYSNHMWDGWWFTFNARSWAKLPRDLQEIVARDINATAMIQRQDMLAADARLEAELKEKGMVFNTLDTDPFRQILKTNGFYEEWRKKFGADAWKHLENAVGPLV
ncbi:MAG: TRAP transporter substrate-binding protein [Candidatus Accumulibacter sp.]|jgi:tripartite ATP-independent transporter DctP family solute receptor|nr:TRAP transporter substrate-binding protein [Accumulibacter sp.]